MRDATPLSAGSQAPDPSRHPCFHREASGHHGRMHLPVAPRCNIQCNYCNRKFDCVNESRPGVSSAVLAPFQALEYARRVIEKEPRIAVLGIAGPGDPMANADETLETMRLLRREFPHLLFCLSSNGLAMPERVDDLAALGLTHATVTLNTVDPDIGARIYAWVRHGGKTLTGREAAELMLERQLAAIAALKARGLVVKVNTIVIPGVNDGAEALTDVARAARELGADLMNLMPMHPTQGTPFGSLPEPGKEGMAALRQALAPLMPQMTHCRRCRADAVGLLCSDRSGEFGEVLAGCGKLPAPANAPETASAAAPGKASSAKAEPDQPASGQTVPDSRPYVAVASRSSVLVDTHLGAARRLQIWGRDRNGGFRLREERTAVRGLGGGCGCGDTMGVGGGCGGGSASQGRMDESGWAELAANLADCRAVVAQEAGDLPRRTLGRHGIPVILSSGEVRDALREAFGRQG